MDTAPAFVIDDVSVFVDKPNQIATWTSKMAIDADGGLHTYRPDNTGRDYLANAKDKRGNWVGVVTVNGKPFISPVTGGYVSTTSYQRPEKSVCDPARYLDAEIVPYVAVPTKVIDCLPGIVMGCRCLVSYKPRSGPLRRVLAVVGDCSGSHIGEGSVALADLLGIPSDPKTGGVGSGVAFEVHAGVPVTLNGETFQLRPE